MDKAINYHLNWFSFSKPSKAFIDVDVMVIIVFTMPDKNRFYLYYIMLIAVNIDVN
jgi:hypothetical protein